MSGVPETLLVPVLVAGVPFDTNTQRMMSLPLHKLLAPGRGIGKKAAGPSSVPGRAGKGLKSLLKGKQAPSLRLLNQGAL